MDVEFRYYTLPKILAGVIIVLAVVLGLAVGGYQPLASVLHLRTTVPYYVTLTRTIMTVVNNTVTVVANHTLTVTSQVIVTSTYTTTATATSTTTIRATVTQPVTTTVTTTTTTATPVYYTMTTTFTETVASNNITLPPLDIYNATSILNYLKANYSLGWFAYVRSQNVTQYGFCISTLYILPNASVIWLGAWIMPWWYALTLMSSEWYAGTLPGGYSEYTTPGFGIGYLPPGWIWPVGVAGGEAYLINIDNYPLPNYTVAVIGNVIPSIGMMKNMQWDFEHLQNGTYVMALSPPGQSIVLIPHALCLVQVIRVNPSTPNSLLLNMTYWGAQYWAWVRSIGQFGKPAPCYVPFEWTVGYELDRINITEPIGSLWQYYCGPNGIWRNLKP